MGFYIFAWNKPILKSQVNIINFFSSQNLHTNIHALSAPLSSANFPLSHFTSSYTHHHPNIVCGGSSRSFTYIFSKPLATPYKEKK